MKTLYYNPIEPVTKVRIKSECFKVDMEYEPYNSNGCPVYIEELFDLAKSEYFEEVAVYLTSHEEAYLKPSKLSGERKEITGWISLKGIANGGGYLNDKSRRFNFK